MGKRTLTSPDTGTRELGRWMPDIFLELPDAIVVADAENGLIVEVNRAVERLTGRARGELLGQPITTLHPPETAAAQRAQAVRADRLRSLGEMAAGIAHELNQPLGGIRALAEQNLIALRRGWPVQPEELSRELQLLVEQTDRMSRIINHVRLFSREAGKPDVQDTDVNEVVASSTELMREQLRAHEIDLVLQLSRALPPVKANPFSLEEVFLNLLTNARDAVTSAKRAGAATVTVTSSVTRTDGQDWVQVGVLDTGPGIAPGILHRVFEPFFTTKPPDQGTGLGLSIARALVESFGGRITIESQLGAGTLATVRLPIADREVPS
jgi:signal transduction histidine kinase